MTFGAIVVGGPAAGMARAFHALQRSRFIDEVVVVLPGSVDPRTAAWASAVAGARAWRSVRIDATTPGAAFNAGVTTATADCILVLEPGDTPSPRAGQSYAAVFDADDRAAVVAGAVRLRGIGVNEVVFPADVISVASFDPGHPGLRGLCWRRLAIVQAGGFDRHLPCCARYELWLRLQAAGLTTRASPEEVLEVSIDPGSALRAELSSLSYAPSVRDVLARHAATLAADLGAVMASREQRLRDLKSAEHAASRRRQSAISHRIDPNSAPPKMPVSGDPANGERAMIQRATPRSRDWGYERGGPLDRLYIEQFLSTYADDIRGAVLEVQEADYTLRFGGGRVRRSDVLDLVESNAAATIIADLRAATNIPDETYDCLIITQTLHVIEHMREAVAELHRILRPGGVLLATFPLVSRICLEYGPDGDFWRVTPAGARALIEPVFESEAEIVEYGNVGTSAAFLHGLSIAELERGLLAPTDPFNPMLIGVRAVKRPNVTAGPAIRRSGSHTAAVLLYHRVGGVEPDPHHINVDQEAFARQMAWLSESCTLLPLAELVAGATRGTLPPRALAVTFDDGYVDTLTNAAPILSALGIPATCFVVTAELGETHEFWWDRLAAALLGHDVPGPLTVSLGGRRRNFAMTSAGERLFAHGVVYDALARTAPDQRESVLSELRNHSCQSRLGPACRRMSIEQLRQLAALGISLGAHTVTHPHLPDLPGDEQVTQIVESRRTLEHVVGTPVEALAYPFGSFDEVTIASAAEAGITHAFTCEPRLLARADGPLRLPRLDLQAMTFDRFAASVERLFSRA